MTGQPENCEQMFSDAQRKLLALRSELNAVIVGQENLVTELLIALFSGGHVLLEGLPGLGKTHLTKALAKSLSLELARIQCTPDLMPADITGSEVLVRRDGGAQAFEFQRGPIFAPMVLVDEINRATPKTQSSLLEAMQERQVTYLGKAYRLPEPFWVLATQNPIELEGTYPLPEAQLDRFLFKLQVRAPDKAALLKILDTSLDQDPENRIQSVLTLADVSDIINLARQVLVAQPIKQAAVDLLMATHPEQSHASAGARAHIRYGVSPRGLQALVRTARVRALLEGRAHVALEDLQAVALPAFRHRLLLSMESEMQGIAVDQVLKDIIQEWREQL